MANLANLTVNDTGYLQVASGTAAQRPTAATGMIRYNSSHGDMEIYNSSQWISGSTASSLIVNNGLVMNLDPGNPGSYMGSGTLWADLSGNINNGTLVNTPTFNTSNSGVLNFNNGPYTSISNASSMRPATEMTVCMWLKANSTPSGWVTLLGQNPYSGGYLIFLETGSLMVRALHYPNGSEVRCNTSNTISTSIWTHVAFTFKMGDAIRSYFNGATSTTVALSSGTFSYNTTNPFYIAYGGSSNYDGLMGPVQLYNRALSQQEIRQNYFATAGIFNLATNPYVPDAPTIGSAAAVTNSQNATVAFTAPMDNGGATITGYTATSSPGSITGTSTTSPITVSSLTKGQAYTFTVTATNLVGTSVASSASNSVTCTTVPGAPTGVSAARSGYGYTTMSVSFSAPSDNGGTGITNYTVTSSPGGITASGASSPIAISGLSAGTSYTFTVTATNAVGTGSASSASSALSTYAYPTGGTITTSGNYRIHSFTTGGTFYCDHSITTDYLIVAGGGGGGSSGGTSWEGGGGGGAGGLLSGSVSINGSYSVVIGGGGGASSAGSNSSVYGLTAYGGGYGGNYPNYVGGNGGSGGGGFGYGGAQSGGTGMSGQGNNGGIGNNGTNPMGGGGGGGRGGVGGDGTSSGGGSMGPGLASSITGSSVTYAQGGQGGFGTAGASSSTYGGGGGGAQNYSGTGGSGTGGIVVIRYLYQ